MLIARQSFEDNSYINLSSVNGIYNIDCRINRKVLGPTYYHYEYLTIDKAIHHMATLIKITQNYHGIGRPIYY